MRPFESTEDRKIGVVAVSQKAGVCTATIQRWVKAGHFLAPMRMGIGKNCRMEWWESEVDVWIAVQEAQS